MVPYQSHPLGFPFLIDLVQTSAYHLDVGLIAFKKMLFDVLYKFSSSLRGIIDLKQSSLSLLEVVEVLYIFYF